MRHTEQATRLASAIPHFRRQRRRPYRRWLLGGGLAAAVVFTLFEPRAPAGGTSAAWPSSQMARRAFINCYHAAERGPSAEPAPAAQNDAGTAPSPSTGAQP